MDIAERFGPLARILDHQLFVIAGTPVSGATVVTVLAVLLGAKMAARAMAAAIRTALRYRKIDPGGRWAVLLRLLEYLVLGLAVAIAADTIGLELSALFAAGAVFAVGFGFAMQTIAQNFVSGVILMIEGAIKPGDILEFEGQVVRIGEMGIRSTVARTTSDEELIIPNSAIVQGTVKNLTHHDRLMRLRVTVGVSYGSDMAQVEEVLQRTADAVSWRVADLEPRVLLAEFGASSVDWEVSVWTDDPWERRRYMSDLRKQVWFALQEAGITIAFPQLDVHFDPAGPPPFASPPV